jgi:iron complex outermembrane receptor protein
MLPVNKTVRNRGRLSQIRFGLVSTSSMLAFALLAEGPSAAQTISQAQDPNRLPQVDVSTQRPRPQTTARPAPKGGSPKRAARPPAPATTTPAQTNAPGGPGGTTTPLNTNTVATSASRLGLTVRETPATVEIVDQQTIQERGYRTVTETAQGVPGVTAGDFPAEPAAFSMRGFTSSHINTLYNGIKIGPQNFTSRTVDTYNLDRVEFLKGPSSLMSGEGATGGSVNLVNKQPHTGKIENDSFVSYDSFGTLRTGFGSGGSTAVQGLDYRFDISRSWIHGFVDDTHTNTFNLTTQLNYRASETFKAFVALDYKRDDGSPYWGTPLVSTALAGPNAVSGIVSGSHTSFNLGVPLGPVTIDGRTLTTNYDVRDNINKAEELWLRGGVEFLLADNLVLKSQGYGYKADRQWRNSEQYAFNPADGMVSRDRFYVAHDQLLYGNMTDLTWNTRFAGMDNRAVFAVGASRLEFTRPGQTMFPNNDEVSLVNPDRGVFGTLFTRDRIANINNVYLSVEDRLKLTPAFALIGGARIEEIDLYRTNLSIGGAPLAGFPFNKTWTPLTGRAGFTWDFVPGLTWYGQVASAADVSANFIFLLDPSQPLDLTRTLTYETGLKQLLWNNRAEWTLSVFDTERKNVFAAAGGQQVNLAGRLVSKGIEFNSAIRPTDAWKLWANFAFVDAKYADFVLADGTSYTGHTPTNVPRVVFNAGASYRLPTWLPVEVGASVRHVGDRFNADVNDVKMLAYTTADAYIFVDLDKTVVPSWGIEKTRLAFRVRNLTDTKYAAWGDPFYPDQILLGPPRSFEVSASFKF